MPTGTWQFLVRLLVHVKGKRVQQLEICILINAVTTAASPAS